MWASSLQPYGFEGAGASTGVVAAVTAGSDADLKSALDALSPEVKAKLAAALNKNTVLRALSRSRQPHGQDSHVWEFVAGVSGAAGDGHHCGAVAVQ